MAGAGIVRDFVVLEACLRRELRHQPILGGRDLLRGHEDWTFTRLGRWGPSPTASCGSNLWTFARLGRWGPSPTTSCGSNLWTFARLGRWGPSPTTSCGSHYGHAARVPEAALVEHESIGGEMIRLPAQHAFDRGLPGRQIEPGKAVDEI